MALPKVLILKLGLLILATFTNAIPIPNGRQDPPSSDMGQLEVEFAKLSTSQRNVACGYVQQHLDFIQASDREKALSFYTQHCA